MKKNEETKARGGRDRSLTRTALVHGLGRCPSVFRTVQSEGLNHPPDKPAFGRRIGTQSLAKTAKEGQELHGNVTGGGTEVSRHQTVPASLAANKKELETHDTVNESKVTNKYLLIRIYGVHYPHQAGNA